MGLKPSPRTAVLVKERVQEVLHSESLSESEKEAMREFDRDLERYLK
jgi:triphosphoribosyl-dephospho-CoA synthetase